MLWIDRLRRLFGGPLVLEQQNPAKTPAPAPMLEARAYLERVRLKMEKLVQDFVEGRVNRLQFEELYRHYQEERNTVENLITLQPNSNTWQTAITEGESLMIRRRYAAQASSYVVFDKQSHDPIRQHGEPSPYNRTKIRLVLNEMCIASDIGRAKALDLGVGGAGQWLCYVCGQCATLIVFFNKEPARVQLQLLEDLHNHFERLNWRIMTRPHYDPVDLVFPYAAAFE